MSARRGSSATARKDEPGDRKASLTAGLAALQPQTRISLLQRGQRREQHLLQLSISRAQEGGGIRRVSTLKQKSVRRLSASPPAFTRSTRNVLTAGDDHLDDLLKGVAASMNSPEHLPQSAQEALVMQAVLGLWFRRHEARGFRRWKESTMHRVDLETLLAAGVNVHEEARQLLLGAETKRRMLSNGRNISATGQDDDDDETRMRADFSYAESDLLLAWARHTQAKTFRGVDDNTVREALRYLRFRQYQEGDAIFYQGDKGDVFYSVLDGSVGIYGAPKRSQQPEKNKRNPSLRGDSAAKNRSRVTTRGKPDLNFMGPRIFMYRSGESFGETALFTNAAVRTATAIAFGATRTGSESSMGCVCELGELTRGVYSRTLKKFHQHFFTQAQCVNFAQRLFLFKDWPRPRVMEVAEVLELRRISFGSVLLSQGVSPLSHCFFVLSGAVNITTQLEIESSTDDESSAIQSAAARKKARRRAQLTIELRTIRVGEIVALEALLETEDSTARVAYTAVGGSADVEVYALNRSDGKAFLASSTVSVVQQVHTICATEHAHREERIQVARRALSERGAINKKNRLKLENEAFELGLTYQQQRQRQKEQELEDLNKLSSIDSSRGPLGLLKPFLPHLDPTKLMMSVDENNPVAIAEEHRFPNREVEIDTSLGEVAVPPKMLSTVVRNFVVRDWDTLEDDYSQRLTLQLPVRGILSLSPLLNPRPVSLTSRTDMALTQMHTARRRRPPVTMSARLGERQMRDMHMRQLSLDYDTKMLWDPDKKNFVLLQMLPAKETRRQSEPSSNSIISITNDHAEEGTPAEKTAQLSARRTLDPNQRQHSVGPTRSAVHFS